VPTTSGGGRFFGRSGHRAGRPVSTSPSAPLVGHRVGWQAASRAGQTDRTAVDEGPGDEHVPGHRCVAGPPRCPGRTRARRRQHGSGHRNRMSPQANSARARPCPAVDRQARECNPDRRRFQAPVDPGGLCGAGGHAGPGRRVAATPRTSARPAHDQRPTSARPAPDRRAGRRRAARQRAGRPGPSPAPAAEPRAFPRPRPASAGCGQGCRKDTMTALEGRGRRRGEPGGSGADRARRPAPSSPPQEPTRAGRDRLLR
jgi:hypothetical protein